MTAFKISRETRDRLEFYGVVVGVATQPAWLRWDSWNDRATPKRADSPWEVKLYPDVEYPAMNAKSIAVGFGDTPDEAVERALSHPEIKYRSRLSRALWQLEAEMRSLEWTIRWALERHERGLAPRPAYTDDFDDDIPF